MKIVFSTYPLRERVLAIGRGKQLASLLKEEIETKSNDQFISVETNELDQKDYKRIKKKIEKENIPFVEIAEEKEEEEKADERPIE